MRTSSMHRDTVVVRAIGADVPVDLAGMPDGFAAEFAHSWHMCIEGAVEAGGIRAERVRAIRTLANIKKGPSTDDLARAHMTLTQDITRAAIAAQAGRLLMLHAGALSNPETGATIVFVAPAGTGKTTMTRLHGPGLAYVTDETVAVTADGVILPYPKPLSVRRGKRDPIKDELAPGDLGLRPATVAPWVAGIVALKRWSDTEVSGPEGIILDRIDILDALTMLAPETSALGLLPRPLHRVADLLETTGGLHRVRYREAEALAPLVSEVTGRAA
jgi:hypothetical protein